MDIKLKEFEKDYWNSLPKDKKELYYQPQKGDYHILLLDGKRVGIGGVFLSKEVEGIGFFQIYIEEKFRGKGILKKVAELIYKKYNLKRMIATIKKQNLISIKAHLKAGFIEENKEKQKELIEKGWQKPDEIRFVWQ